MELWSVTMAKSTINVRVDSGLKTEVQRILNAHGLSLAEGISMFLNQVKLLKGIPFEVKVPNDATVEAIQNLESGRDVTEYETVDELFRDLKS